MTDELDTDGESDLSVAEPNFNGSESENLSRDGWESLASNPDFSADLGYEVSDWEQFETLDNTDQVIFLPDDESELKDAAFVVADQQVVCDLENNC